MPHVPRSTLSPLLHSLRNCSSGAIRTQPAQLISFPHRPPAPAACTLQHQLRSRFRPVAPTPRSFRTTAAMLREFKLKDISSLSSVAPGSKAEFDLESPPEGAEGKILLVNLGHGEPVHALSSRCTHYGAPLRMGVLGKGERLICPWHGACFNVKTGDIEDAPALDPLAKYEVTERDGAVYIKADEATLKANRGKMDVACPASKGDEKVVIVGGGSGAIGVLEGLHASSFRGSITVISSEPHPPIDRTKLSKALLSDPAKLALRPESFYTPAQNITLKLSTTVSSISPPAHTVTTSDGTSIPYTKLVLATGGTPRWLPLPGLKTDAHCSDVFVLRTVADAEKINAAAGNANEGGKKKDVVVVGSSFIGLELAVCLSGRGHAVSVIGMEATPLERVLGAKVGAILQKMLEANNKLKFHLNAGVERAEGEAGGPAKAILLKDGTRLPADLVVLGVGVAPATAWLKGSEGLPELLRDGSLATDAQFGVEGARDVFAVGDIATYAYRGPGGPTAARIEHWNVAQNAGRVVAAVIAGQGAGAGAETEAKATEQARGEFVPVFWSALGSNLRYAGYGVGFDDVHVHGDESKPAFVAWYTKGDEVVAVATVGKDPVMAKAVELWREGRMIGREGAVKGVDVLEM